MPYTALHIIYSLEKVTSTQDMRGLYAMTIPLYKEDTGSLGLRCLQP